MEELRDGLWSILSTLYSDPSASYVLCVQLVRGEEGDAAVSLAEGLFLPTSLDEPEVLT